MKRPHELEMVEDGLKPATVALSSLLYVLQRDAGLLNMSELKMLIAGLNEIKGQVETLSTIVVQLAEENFLNERSK